MKPITRETITDRRQRALRWSAVLGGAAVAVALWVLLQMFGMGVGMASIDLDDRGSLLSVGIGTTVWTLVAPLIALFIGGLVAGRLAQTYDRSLGALHGFVTWAIASLLGMLATVSMVGMLTGGSMRSATRGLALSDDVTVHRDMRRSEVQEATDRAGKMLLGGSLSLLLGLGAAVGGAVFSARTLVPRRKRHSTTEVPVVPMPPEPPANAPRVTES